MLKCFSLQSDFYQTAWKNYAKIGGKLQLEGAENEVFSKRRILSGLKVKISQCKCRSLKVKNNQDNCRKSRNPGRRNIPNILTLPEK